MRKKVSAISSVLLSLGLVVLGTGICFAKLNVPESPKVAMGCEQYENKKCIGEGSAKLEWGWETGGTGGIKQFKILFKIGLSKS